MCSVVEDEAMKDTRIYLIEWTDACGVSQEWLPTENRSEDFISTGAIISVGFIIRADEKSIVICPHISKLGVLEGEQTCGDMCIPSRVIDRIMVIYGNSLKKRSVSLASVIKRQRS